MDLDFLVWIYLSASVVLGIDEGLVLFQVSALQHSNIRHAQMLPAVTSSMLRLPRQLVLLEVVTSFAPVFSLNSNRVHLQRTLGCCCSVI